MDFDIEHILKAWEFKPGQILVRRFEGNDGQEKIQLRLDLGILQMNAEGRPDGKRPFEFTSWLDYCIHRLDEYLTEHDGDDEGFVLGAEDCAEIQLEALQYHHRYICFMQLEDFDAVVRDADRNIDAMEFLEMYAESEDLFWNFTQLFPQLMLIRTRALGAVSLKKDDFAETILIIKDGISSIQDFYIQRDQSEMVEESEEIASLHLWMEDIDKTRPLSKRERLEKAMEDAVLKEEYEKAAHFRDALRKLRTRRRR
ncbi:MAG: UvrB/UvrC motif-containing protein [Verrucomicrobia bacterium]|nr:UvrB/UvrC motif-containing protein [Verrucomicrobiota bacterium]